MSLIANRRRFRSVASLVLAMILACGLPLRAVAATTPVFGVCTDSKGNPLADVLLQIWSYPPGKPPPRHPGIQLGIEPGLRPFSEPTDPELVPVALLTTQRNGEWSLELEPGTYLFNAQALGRGGADLLSTERVVTLDPDKPSVALQLGTVHTHPVPPPLQDARRVFFVSDRLRLPGSLPAGELPLKGLVPSTTLFDNKRGAGFSFGTCDVEASRNQRAMCEVGDQPGTLSAFWDDVAHSPAKRAVIYVHGFNVSYPEAMRTGGLLAKATKSTVFVYDWTSFQNPAPPDYDSDEENLTWSLNNGMALLVALVCNKHGASVSLFAHSLGTRAIVQVLSFINTAQQVGTSLQSPNIKLIDLAASDLDVRTFEDNVPLFKHFGITTNTYASRNDNALKLSHADHALHNRVGEDAADVGGMMPQVISVDATPGDPISLTDLIGHGYFQHEDFMEDIAQFYAGAVANARGHLAVSDNGSFWWFKQDSGPPTIQLQGIGFSPDRIVITAGSALKLVNANMSTQSFIFGDDSAEPTFLNPKEASTHVFPKAGTFHVRVQGSEMKSTVIVLP